MSRPTCPRLVLSLVFALLAVSVTPRGAAADPGDRPPTPDHLRHPGSTRPALGDGTPGKAKERDPSPARRRDEPELDRQKQEYVREAIASARSEIGGTDVLVADDARFGRSQVEIDDGGRIFVAVNVIDDQPQSEYVLIFRSTDGGTTFPFWAQLGGGSGDQSLLDLDIAGGSNSRIFVTTRDLPDIFGVQIHWADPAAQFPTWTVRDPLPDDVSFTQAQLELDDRSFDSYFCYLVGEGNDGDGGDIWFARSTDQGANWASPYRIAAIDTDDDVAYLFPRISYGFGGVLHVAFIYGEYAQDEFDDAVRYLRAVDYGGDPSDWQLGLTAITATNDGTPDGNLDIQASLDDATVVIGYEQNIYTSSADAWLFASTNGGGSWPSGNHIDLPWERNVALEYRRPGAEFVAAGIRRLGPFDNLTMLSRASIAAPLDWSTPQVFSDWERVEGAADLALDPTRNERVAVTIEESNSLFSDIYHDAEWRGDPGFPNPEPFNPRELDAPAISAPALVDLDADGDLEIVFGDADDRIQILHHDGQSLDGWPQTVPGLSASPIAVGELRVGEPSVVAGTDGGEVFVFDPDGQLRDGWPVAFSTPATAHVSIGALGGPSPRVVAAACGDRLEFYNDRGMAPPGAPGWSFTTGDFTSPAAFGDVDGDGVTEVVVTTGFWALAIEMTADSADLLRQLPSVPSAAVSLADLDFDGRVEIIVPTESGQLFVLDGTGSDHPGFPFASPTGSPLTAAAVANVLGNAEPEIAFSARSWTTHLVYQNGSEQSGYPVQADVGLFALAAPVMGRVDGFSSDVVIATRGGDVSAFDNFGGLVEGWPLPVGEGNEFELTPAMGDVDLDGRNEIVALDQDLMIIDVGAEPHQAASTWAMHAHDPQRTGCADCPEDVVTGVDPRGPSTVTRVRFAGAGPNPVAGASTDFRFAVPVRAAAELSVFDLRGRLVRRVLRSEVDPGEHVVSWNGRDAAGRRVASGQYLARLRVSGPGVDEHLTRGVTVVR